MSANITTVFQPTVTITVSDQELASLLAQNLVLTVNGGPPIVRPVLSPALQAELVRQVLLATDPNGALGQQLLTSLSSQVTPIVTAQVDAKAATFITNASRDSGSGVGIAIGDGVVGPQAFLVRSPETAEKLLVARDNLQVRNRFGVGSAPSSRTPFTALTRVDGSTLSAEAKSADKVGFALNTRFVGGFTNEASYGASNPTFLFGFNAFNIFGQDNGVGDLAGINTIYGNLLETHVSSPDANLTTLNGVMVETSTNSSITEVRGINVVGHRPGTAPGSAAVQTAVGVNISSPTMGTTRWALRTQGTAASQFGGDLYLSLDPGAPGLFHAYSGEVRSKRVSVGGSTVTTQGGVNVASLGMLTVKSNADSDVVASFQGRGSQSGDIVRVGRDTAATTRFDGRARLIFQSNTALADADLVAGEGGIWVDNSNFGSERMNFRGKATNGTIRPTVQVPLNPLSIAAAATDATTTQALVNDLRAKLVSLGWFV